MTPHCLPSRRDAVRIGALTALGLGWRHAAAAGRARAKSCILLWLDGGPSHLETWDLKPDAPAEQRGPFRPMRTAVPGLEICELMPRTAAIAKHIAVIRSVTSPLGEHGLANHYLLTGYAPSPSLQYPAFGAVVAHAHDAAATLPRNVAIPSVGPAGGAGFLGSRCAPFAVGGDPAAPGFAVRDLEIYPGMTAGRIDDRRRFVAHLDRWQRDVETESAFEPAFRLVTSPEAKQAFDLGQETPATRARYGMRTLGQSCLLARRLVERGVPFVTINNPGWDTHSDLVVRLQEGYAGAKVGVGLIPTFDVAFAALVSDLHERGLLDQTLVVAMGEFGRTPKINVSRGRDHWPRVFSIAMAGGGIAGGQVVGRSDPAGESPADRPVTPADLAATIYTLLGIDPATVLHTADGRPVTVNSGGQRIRELLA